MGIGIAVFPASYNRIVHLLLEGLDGNIGSLAKMIIAMTLYILSCIYKVHQWIAPLRAYSTNRIMLLKKISSINFAPQKNCSEGRRKK